MRGLVIGTNPSSCQQAPDMPTMEGSYVSLYRGYLVLMSLQSVEPTHRTVRRKDELAGAQADMLPQSTCYIRQPVVLHRFWGVAHNLRVVELDALRRNARGTRSRVNSDYDQACAAPRTQFSSV